MAGTIVRRLLDLTIAVAIALVAWNAVQAHRAQERLEEHRRIEATPAATLGSELPIPGIDWAQAPRHVVLLLSTECPACNQSTPFYVTLAAEAARQSPRVPVTVLSQQPLAQVREWLQAKGLRADTVMHVDRLGRYGFREVPAVLIVDARGRVTDIMARLLAPPDEARLLARVASAGEPLNNQRPIPEIAEGDLLSYAAGAFLLDVRDRGAFAASHRAGAVNIPKDELSERLRAEVPADRAILVDCQDLALSQCRGAAERVVASGYAQVRLIRP